jgi:hypothetical protein
MNGTEEMVAALKRPHPRLSGLEKPAKDLAKKLSGVIGIRCRS